MSAATSVYLNLDVVMLQFMKGDIEVGYYNAGIKVKTVLVTCVTSLGTVMLPRLSYYVQQEAEEAFRKLVAKAFSFVLIVATAVSIYFTLYAKESILLLAGKDFLPAVGPMVILMPTVLFDRIVQYYRHPDPDATGRGDQSCVFGDGGSSTGLCVQS